MDRSGIASRLASALRTALRRTLRAPGVAVHAVGAAGSTLITDLFVPGPIPREHRPHRPWAVAAGLAPVAGLVIITAGNQLGTEFDLDPVSAIVLGTVQGLALVGAVLRPVAAWWAALLATFAAGVLARPDSDPVWPWAIPSLVILAGILFLVSFRYPARIAAETVTITFLSGIGLGAIASHGVDFDELPLSLAILGTVVVVGTALRSRRVARIQQRRLEELTAEERTRRTLLEERQRIARELHDVAAHHMTLISIQAQVASRLAENPSEALQESLTGIRTNAVEALAELRRVLGLLRAEELPVEEQQQLPQPGLERLHELADKARGAGVPVTDRVVGEPRPLPPGIELSAYRIAQEGLSNAIRHAPGAMVAIEIEYEPDRIGVRVVNTAGAQGIPAAGGDSAGRDGGGRDGGGRDGGGGQGLVGMRERTSMLGGELVAGPTPDGGYEVTAILPTTPLVRSGP